MSMEKHVLLQNMFTNDFATMNLSWKDSRLNGSTLTEKEKFQVQQLVKKATLTVFWDINLIEKGATVNSIAKIHLTYRINLIQTICTQLISVLY